MKYARVLLISTTAWLGPTFCPGSERAGCPSGVITDYPRCTPWCESSWCDAARVSSPPEDRRDPSAPPRRVGDTPHHGPTRPRSLGHFRWLRPLRLHWSLCGV